MTSLEHLTFNISNSPIRKERLHRRDYIVAPVVMLTEGVHAGSNGPLLYRGNDCRSSVPAWNNKPIVVYHPEIDGRGVSAASPAILEKQQVGMVLNTRWDSKLRAEAWIEEERCREVDRRVLDALELNRLMEVSTGLFTDNVAESGEWNGEHYDYTATNHRPDHLALLPDRIGACSVADGAGLLQLNEAARSGGLPADALLSRCFDQMRRLVGNALSHDNIRSALGDSLRTSHKGEDVWVVEVFGDHFIYELSSKLYRQGYARDGDSVTITGEPVEVVQTTQYKDVSQASGPAASKRSTTMSKKAIDALIANEATPWEESDRQALEGFSDEQLEKLTANAEADDEDEDEDGDEEDEDGDEGGKKPKKTAATSGSGAAAEGNEDGPVGNQQPRQVTMDQYIANAPPEYRDVLKSGLKAHNETKASLVKQITANEANTFSAEFLNTKGIEELQALAALAAPRPSSTPAAVPMFHGAATPAGPVHNQGGSKETPLKLKKMDFSDRK